MDFPQSISFTITNVCNLRCKMCGQWSEEGYMHGRADSLKDEMRLGDWKRLVDELAEHQIPSLLLRGGETFAFPGIIELLAHIQSKGLFTAIDTNGTWIKKYAEEIARIGNIHLTISLDGPEAIHDQVRGVKGTYARIREGIDALNAAELRYGNQISKSFNFTISPYSLDGLGALPEAVRSMGVGTVAIVPYYYFPKAVGEAYTREMEDAFGCPAFSWIGFHHEQSGVDFERFQAQHRQFLEGLNGIYDYPYMALSDEEYRDWFADSVTPIGPQHCTNVERLIDIQPDGEANFCVDFPDYSIGNVRDASIAEVWNSERAERFRAYRRQKPLAVCYRCGAKYMSEIVE
jgi:MoaA/NifB/PqqE/SkfB family radical SAM enzyme